MKRYRQRGRPSRPPEWFFLTFSTKHLTIDNDFFAGPSNRAKGNAMESEKLVYWATLGVLAMAVITGVATERGWSDRLADRSIAMISRASEKARSYAEIARVVLESGEVDSVRAPQPELASLNEVQSEVQNEVQDQVQNRLACVQRVLVHRQAEMARLQAMRVQVRMLKRSPRTIVWPNGRLVVEVPQPPQVRVDTF
jgi:hypothetical protein